MALIGLCQMAVRLPLTYIADPVPFATGGVFWAGIAAVPMMLIIGLIIDCGAAIWWVIRLATVRAKRPCPRASEAPRN